VLRPLGGLFVQDVYVIFSRVLREAYRAYQKSHIWNSSDSLEFDKLNRRKVCTLRVTVFKIYRYI